MLGIDYLVIGLYLVLLLSFVLLFSRSSSLEVFLANDRSTRFWPLLLSIVASWVGAGAVLGVASASYKSGISYALTVSLANIAFMGLFAYFAPGIKERLDGISAYTVGEFMSSYHGRRSQIAVSFVYVLAACIWTAVQFLAIAQLLAAFFDMNLSLGMFCAFAITIAYTLVGGLRADIFTDVVQFFIMLIVFLLMVPIVVVKAGGLSQLANLPATYYDPFAFGGSLFLFGSILLGAVYPFVNVHEWQRVIAAKSASTARRAYLWAIPLCVLFVSSASLIGLFASQMFRGNDPDNVFFTMMRESLPVGLLGLGVAGILALVMSSVDSLILAGAATIRRDIFPEMCSAAEKQSALFSYRVVCFLFAFFSLCIAIYYPRIVDLTLFATFISVAVAPAVIATLLNYGISTKRIELSMVLGVLTLLGAGWYLGMIIFIPTIVMASLPLLIRKTGSSI